MRRPLRIAQIGHPILRQPTRILTREELLSEEIQSFLDDLVETMREASVRVSLPTRFISHYGFVR